MMLAIQRRYGWRERELAVHTDKQASETNCSRVSPRILYVCFSSSCLQGIDWRLSRMRYDEVGERTSQLVITELICKSLSRSSSCRLRSPFLDESSRMRSWSGRNYNQSKDRVSSLSYCDVRQALCSGIICFATCNKTLIHSIITSNVLQAQFKFMLLD